MTNQQAVRPDRRHLLTRHSFWIGLALGVLLDFAVFEMSIISYRAILATLGIWALALVLTVKKEARPLGIGVLVGSFVPAVLIAGFLVRYGLDIGTTT